MDIKQEKHSILINKNYALERIERLVNQEHKTLKPITLLSSTATYQRYKLFFKEPSHEHHYAFSSLSSALRESLTLYRMESHFLYNQYLSVLNRENMDLCREGMDFLRTYFSEELISLQLNKGRKKELLIELIKYLLSFRSRYHLVFKDDKRNLITSLLKGKSKSRRKEGDYLYLMSYLNNLFYSFDISCQKVKINFDDMPSLQDFLFNMDQKHLSFLRVEMKPECFLVEGLLLDDKFDITSCCEKYSGRVLD